MGAYKRGEIKKICELVQPDISVITGISEQHLALFGKLENTLKTKYEIVEYAKDDVVVVINGDCDLCLRIAGKSGKKEILYSAKKELSLWASDIKPTKDHVVFNVHYKKETQQFDVQMFGEYNVSNVLAATAVALQLGMTLAEISRSLSQSSSTRKVGRIAIKRSRFGYRVIDDSYNSNSQGFLAALDFLSFIKADKHILVTIGILELGEKVNEIYDKLSKKIVDVCDVLVTTDKRLVKIVKKRDADFKVVFDTGVDKQLSFLRSKVSKRDVVLFEGPNQRIISEIVNSEAVHSQ